MIDGHIDTTKLHVLKEGCCAKNGWITWHLCEFCHQAYTPVEGHDCPPAKLSNECVFADAVLDAYVAWNENCLRAPDYGKSQGEALDKARADHFMYHYDERDDVDCMALCINRLGWPSTVWRNGEPTTTWDHNARG